MSYKKLDRIFGWVAFLVAAIVYLMTIEPTVSFWDCGEFISSSYKLEVGHPPGAPTFMVLARVASLFASEPAMVAKMVNSLSALASAFTIMFLFWTIVYFAKRIIATDGKITTAKGIAIIGSGMIGALAYTFSDTFWFSAVEGEVYATSSLFTAVVFWAILKWEQAIDQRHALRWIMLIAILVGLSIGVHLLNLLAIPAMVFVFYFKKYKPSTKGVLASLAISGIILAAIMYGVVPGVAKVAFGFERVFINSMGLPYFTGVFIWIILLLASLAGGIYFTQFKENKVMAIVSSLLGLTLLGIPFLAGSAVLGVLLFIGLGIACYVLYQRNRMLLNTIVSAFAIILIGYSTFSIIVIRSLADPPMDQNNPDNVYSLLSYLNREQYGDRPLFFGHYFNAPADKYNPTKKGKAVYIKKNGKYVVSTHKPVPQYDETDPKGEMRFFPRMYDDNDERIEDYKTWAGVDPNRRITSGQNMKFLFRYQLGWMYWRYFMWNFAGRQNDIQGHGNILHGNWLSGLSFIDTPRLGDQDKLPDYLKHNKAHNKYYMLPLLLGLIGLFFQLNRNLKDWWVVLLLFFLTGIAIVIYLNQYPHQPRERDYAYAGSFYAFSIWIGLGVLGIYSLLKRILPKSPSAVAAILVGAFIPGILAAENWDDHDRSGRYVARDFAHNYLESCAPNAILFTYGDNDTFPIWYAQEVEGIRTDVKVCCLPYFASDWYVDQMRMKTYEAEPMPLSIPPEKYDQGQRDIVYPMKHPNYQYGHVDIDSLVGFLANDEESTYKHPQTGEKYHIYPTNLLKMDADSARILATQAVKKKDIAKIDEEITWNLKTRYLVKNQMMILDLLATNDWERPVYYTSINSSNTMKLDNYFQLEGFAYRMVPIKSDGRGRIDTDILYDNLMNKFKYTNMGNTEVHMDYHIRRTTKIVRLRRVFVRLANALVAEGKTDKAVEVLNKAEEVVPFTVFRPDYFSTPYPDAWYKAGEMDKGDSSLMEVVNVVNQELNFYFSLDEAKMVSVEYEIRYSLETLRKCLSLAYKYKRGDITAEIEELFKTYASQFESPSATPDRQI